MNATEVKLLKKKANQAFDKNDYQSAFKFLWKSGVDEFVAYSQKERPADRRKNLPAKTNWLELDFFWSDFLYQEDVFQKLFSSFHAQDLLHLHFTVQKKNSKKLLSELARQFPEVFIEAVRVNQLFLREDLIELITELELPESLKAHSATWKVLYHRDSTIWKQVEAEFGKLKTLSLNQLFVQAIIWIEQNRFGQSEQEEMHFSGVYSLFAELVSTQSDLAKLKFEAGLMYGCFYNKMVELSKMNPSKRLASLEIHPMMSLLSDWQALDTRIIEPYSFELATNVQDEGGKLTLFETPKRHYNWLVDEARYQFCQMQYQENGYRLLDSLEKEGIIKIPSNETNLNQTIYLKSCSTACFLMDLHLESIEDLLGGEKGGKLKNIFAMIGYCTNRLFRYNSELDSYANYNNYSTDWVDTYLPIFMEETFKNDRENFPFILKALSEYKALNEKVETAFDEIFTEQLLETFAYSPNKYFNRHNRNYDIWEQPFLKIGEHIFTPTFFFASNGFLFSYVQNEFLNRENNRKSRDKRKASEATRKGKQETEAMEKGIGERLSEKNKNWEIRVADNAFTNKMNPNGDVDIFLQDETATLFIQLKRTKFRLAPKEAYYESINVDAKASKQLNKAEKFLKKRTDLYEAKHKPTKWIVSTSFEKANTIVNDCRKINYFELLNALGNPNANTVKDLIVCLENDKHLHDFVSGKQSGKVNMYYESISLPIKPFNSHEYQHDFEITDNAKAQANAQLSKEAGQLFMDGKQQESINKYVKCIERFPENVVLYSILGNILYEGGLQDEAVQMYDASLALLPDDPFTCLRYAQLLEQMKEMFSSCTLFLDLAILYPLITGFSANAKRIYHNHNWNDFDKARLIEKIAKLH